MKERLTRWRRLVEWRTTAEGAAVAVVDYLATSQVALRVRVAHLLHAHVAALLDGGEVVAVACN